MASWMVLGCGLFVLGCAAQSETPGAESSGGSGPAPTRGSGGSSGTQGTGGAKASGGSEGQSTTGGTSGSTTGTGGNSGGGGSPSAGTSGSGGAPASTPEADAGSAPEAGPSAPATPGMGPFGCTNCKPIFDGKTLEGWETRDPTNWLAKDGVLASQGKVPPIWTKADYGDYRIFFKVRQVMGNHKPDVIFFGKRPGPGQGASGALGGAQFQPPNGGSWNYGAGGTFSRPENPMWNANKWHHCEVLVKEAGSFQAACCPMEPEAACKIVLNWKGTGRKHPFAIQMHNPGLFDEYKDIYVEESPTYDGLLCMKK